MRVYLREHRPICYELAFFDNQQLLNDLLVQLSLGDLNLYWKSERLRPLPDTSPAHNLPLERPLTLLTPDKKASFIEDIEERDIDGYGTFIALFGIDSSVALTPSDDNSLYTALENFSAREQSPIRIAVIQVGDSFTEHVFVPHEPVKPIKQLLANWKEAYRNINEIHRYKELRLASLESIFRLASNN